MKNRFHALIAALAVVSAANVVRAGDDFTSCQDKTAIQWFTPGSFAAARLQAENTKRLMMVKGIAFGVDEVGAKCATKGCW